MSPAVRGEEEPSSPRLRRAVAGLAAAALAADLLLWPAVAPFGVVPDTVLATSVALAAGGRRRWALGLAMGGGMALDLSGGQLVGLGAVARALAAMAAGQAARSVSPDRFGVTLAVGASSVAACRLAELAGGAAFGVVVPFSWAAVAREAGFALLTTALFAVALMVLAWAGLTGGEAPRWGP